MKRFVAYLFLLFLMGSVVTVIAAGPNAMTNKKAGENSQPTQTAVESGNVVKDGEKSGEKGSNISGDDVQEQVMNGGAGNNASQRIQVRERVKAQNVSELNEMIKEKREEMKRELASLKAERQEVLKNQNQVRIAVHALLAMENLTGGIGRNVSAIARNFNNSVQATIRAEERIQNRSRMARFFNGGDQVAAAEIEQEVNQNMNRIEQLKMLMQRCNCTDEVKAMFQEQIQNVEQEQNRLGEVAQKEKKSRGLFGALFGWMKRK